MIFSSVLKIKLERYLQRIADILDIAVAIVDENRQVIVKNNLFEDRWLSSFEETDSIHATSVFNDSQSYEIVIKIFTDLFDKTRVKKYLELISEIVQFIIQQENEAQGLIQEILEKYEELNLLYDMISELSTIFDEQQICRMILGRAMKALDVSVGAIMLADNQTKNLRISDLQERAEAQRINELAPILKLAQRSIESGKEILFDDKDKLPSEILDSLANKQLWTTLSVPVRVGEQIIGTIVLIGKLDGNVFQSGDVKLMEAIAGYAGITINSNRMVEQMRVAEALQHEIKLAHNIQQSLLPKQSPKNEYFEIQGICLPAADVGGDFFHFISLNGSLWEIIISDVSGHGIGAALTMASLRSILRSESDARLSTDQIIRNTNRLMCEDTQDTGMYATLFLAIVNPSNYELVYTNAGHQVPLLWKKKEKRFRQLNRGGMPVGMFTDEAYERERVRLSPGDVLVAYTDGLTEAKNLNNKLYNEERLQMVIQKNAQKSAAEILDSIIESVVEFQDGASQRDDITVIVLKVK